MDISNKNLTKKQDLLIKYYLKNTSGMYVLSLIACFITYQSGGSNFFKSIYTILTATLVTWLGHYLLHNYNTYNPIAKIHKITHHSKFAHTFLGKLIEYSIIEFFFFGGGILLILTILYQRRSKVWVFDPYVLFYWSLAVPFIHEVYYHMLQFSDYHKLHHKHPDKVYAPEIWDIIFDTKVDNIPVYNENQLLPTMILLLVIIVPFIGTKYDIIKYFAK